LGRAHSTLVHGLVDFCSVTIFTFPLYSSVHIVHLYISALIFEGNIWEYIGRLKNSACLPKVGHILGGLFPDTDMLESSVIFKKTFVWRIPQR
jgi:hypothetical protein